MASAARRYKSIDECLFGPDRQCPSNVWDAVMSGTTPMSSPSTSPVKKTASDMSRKPVDRIPSSKQTKTTHALQDLGIDDLDSSRWAPPLCDHVIPLQELRRLSSQGIAEQYRGVVWRVLLGGLPLETSQWKDYLLAKRMEYRQLVNDLFVDPQHDGNDLRGHHGKKKKQAQAKRDYEMKKCSSSNIATHDSNTASTSANPNPNPSMTGTVTTHDTTEVLSIDKEVLENDENKNVKETNISQDSSLLASNPNEPTPPIKEETPVIPIDLKTSTSPGNDDVVEVPLQGSNHYGSIKRQNSNDSNLDEGADDTLSEDETKSCESLADMVPMYIQEEWKKTGRDIATLEHMQNGHDLMNTLLVVSDGPPQNDALVSVPPKQQQKNDSDSDPATANDSDSKWFQFFENASLLDEIRKDVVRTHPELFFFLEPENNLGQRRYAALERILFVWAKLNRGVRYVQGMNEIVGTIYYVLANDENEMWACEAEADSYFLFNSLMVEMRDVFVAELDEADTGIQGRISNMTALLSLHDPEVRCHLVDIGIDPAFYAIRWLTTLLSREFLLPDTIRLWDSMFASTHKDNFIRYVCVTMVMIIRNKLLKGDFSTCLRLLQAYPTTNIDGLLEASRALWIYESQVTLACHKGGISLHQALCTITPPPSIIMAYGLPGGVARPHALFGDDPMPSSGLSTSRGFFSRAQNAVMGQINAGVRGMNMNNRGRTQSYDGPTRRGNSHNNMGR